MHTYACTCVHTCDTTTSLAQACPALSIGGPDRLSVQALTLHLQVLRIFQSQDRNHWQIRLHYHGNHPSSPTLPPDQLMLLPLSLCLSLAPSPPPLYTLSRPHPPGTVTKGRVSHITGADSHCSSLSCCSPSPVASVSAGSLPSGCFLLLSLIICPLWFGVCIALAVIGELQTTVSHSDITSLLSPLPSPPLPLPSPPLPSPSPSCPQHFLSHFPVSRN